MAKKKARGSRGTDEINVPDHIIDTLARQLAMAVDAFYADPANEKRYQEWKAKKEQGGAIA